MRISTAPMWSSTCATRRDASQVDIFKRVEATFANFPIQTRRVAGGGEALRAEMWLWDEGVQKGCCYEIKANQAGTLRKNQADIHGCRCWSRIVFRRSRCLS